MSRTFHHQRGRVRVKAVKKRDPADLRRLAKALIALALAEAEEEMSAEADRNETQRDSPKREGGS